MRRKTINQVLYVDLLIVYRQKILLYDARKTNITKWLNQGELNPL